MFFALYTVLAFAPPAYAYVDPSVMTYAIQAFAGVAVALGAVAGVALRRTRKMLFKVLNIDENARKEVEPPVHRLDAEGNPIGVEVPSHASGEPSKKRSGKREPVSTPKWGGRLAYAFVVTAFTVFTVLVVAPFEIVASNGSSLIFGVSEVWLPVVLAAGAVALVVAFLLAFLRGRAFEVVLLIVFSIGLGAYVQAMFLNSALPPADGVPVVWEDYQTITAISAAVWIAIIAVPLVVRHWFSTACRGAAVVLAVCLIAVQSIGLASLFVGSVAHADDEPVVESVSGKPVVTEEGLYDVSPRNNVVVFVIDTLDIVYLKDIMQNNPNMFDEMTGFTYYENTVGAMCPTRWSIPFLLTAQTPQTGESFGSYLERQYSDGAFLPDLVEQGYSVGIYSDSIGLDRLSDEEMAFMEQSTENIHPLESPSAALDQLGAVRVLWKSALYREMPWALKRPFWFYTDEINAGMADRKNADNLGSVAYTLDDPAYYDGLRNYGLSAKDNGKAGSFKFVHLNGSHRPHYMNENAENVGYDNATFEQSYLGSFKIVGEYIQQMKDLGVYEDSTIIVTSDHGEWYYTLEGLDRATGPVLFVKEPMTKEESEQPMKVSDAPASHFDIHPTVMESIGGDAEKYAGIPVDDLGDGPRTRNYIMNACDGKVDVALIEYSVDGDVYDFSNWQKTGRVWEPEN
ncbi:sulfatase-like hydrolase/transferase [Eggerthella lenta]|uniref:sulfatase-like hydrolase/transferase n=1 Tax=Eggerthella lenta TaxID=84112 RepID=UPI0013051593|nr:sulfatase-like hydrolase/transferase [Eggerthella lenta]